MVIFLQTGEQQQQRHLDALIKKAASDLASLNRVSHRLALTEENRLAAVLDKLLPRLLKRIGDNHRQLLTSSLALTTTTTTWTLPPPVIDDADVSLLKGKLDQIHTKLVEMLSHIMKRVKADDTCELPCLDILQQLLPPPSLEAGAEKSDMVVEDVVEGEDVMLDPFTVNLSLAFLTVGVPRMKQPQRLLPFLLQGVGSYNNNTSRSSMQEQQGNQLAHLLLRCLERVVKEQQQHQIKHDDESLLACRRQLSLDDEEDDPRNASCAAHVYCLLLDVMLYQPVPSLAATTTTNATSTTTTTIPPDGLSQQGTQRLVKGHSYYAERRDWGAEMAIPQRRNQLKLAVLDLVAPSNRFALFLYDHDTKDDKTSDKDNNNKKKKSMAADLGLARTVALLIAGCGDPNREVSERAKAYWKAYKDSQRGKAMMPPEVVLLLSMELLSLCLGQVHAEAALLSSSGTATSRRRILLGPPPLQHGPDIPQQLVLATKRRPVSESYFPAMVDLVAKLLEENPQALSSSWQEDDNETTGDEDETTNSSLANTRRLHHGVAAMAVRVAKMKLAKNNNSFSGLTALRAKPLISAAQLLQAVTMRLSVILQNQDNNSHNDNHITATATDSVTTTTTSAISLQPLLAQSLSLVCSVLSGTSSSTSTTTMLDSNQAAFTNEGTLAIRDACYGIVCTLSRCRVFVQAPEGYIFSCGESSLSATAGSSSSGTTISTPTRTVKLLFGCAANEVERLRPRAVAALDALLSAYLWVYVTEAPEPTATIDSDEGRSTDVGVGTVNPWLQEGSHTPPAQGEYGAGTSTNTSSSDVKGDRTLLARSLLPLLWNAAQPYQTKASRVAAARWASDLLKQLEFAGACHLLCFLAGDLDNTAASIAVDGLGLSSCALPCDGLPSPSVKHRLPGFSDIVRAMFPPRSASAGSSETGRHQRYWDFSLRGKAASLQFGIMCLMNDLYDGDNEAIVLYLSAICETLRLYKGPLSDHGRLSIDLLDDTSACLLSLLATSSLSRARILGGETKLTLGDLEDLALGVNSSKARRRLALVCGRLYEAFEFWENRTNLLSSWVSECQIERSLKIVSRGLQAVESSGAASMMIHGCAYLGASIARAVRIAAWRFPVSEGERDDIWDFVSALVTLLGRGTLHTDEVIGNACSDGLATAVSFDDVDAPILHGRMYKPCSVALTELAKALSKYGHGDFMDTLRTTRLARTSGVCLAATSTSAGLQEPIGETASLIPSRIACVNALFGLLGSSSFRKDEEIGLVVGEALALYADSFSPKGVMWASASSEWPTEYVEDYAQQLPPHQHVVYFLLEKLAKSSSPHERNACAAALLAVVARATRGIHSDPSYSQRSITVVLRQRLEIIQQVFIQLLADPKIKHLPRECCCLGLAACRGIAGTINSINEAGENASDSFNGRLLRAFGQTTNFAGSAFMETPAQAAERRATERGATAPAGTSLMEIFGEEDAGGAAGMTESALGAYREMAAASVALGRHDILYGLLVLSVSHSCWSDEDLRDRYSPQALLGENTFGGSTVNSLEIRQALRPHLGKLIPRILRARHDPNKQTRDQMTALWNGLTGGGAEARLAVSQHLLSTLDDLIKDSASKLWRTRVGACGALAEILTGRTWDDLGGGGPVLSDESDNAGGIVSAGVRLLRLWRVTMRAVDDVRGAVRDIGAMLGRAVRSLTIRLCDPSILGIPSGAERGRVERAKLEKDATAASATSLRWLIKHGLGQQCAEAAGVCISTLVEVVSVAKPSMLGPILPELLRSLLMAISGLEPAALNFIQLRTGDQESLEKIRLQLAQSGPLAAAVTKCIELLPATDIETQHAVVAQLDTALRLSGGFATRAAVADSVSSLCSSCPSAFRFASTSTGNPSVRLLRALYFASERERTSAAKDKMVHALGNLAALCPGSSIRALALRVCERYNLSTGNNDDPVSRKAAALAIRAIALRASEQFADGGNADIWRTKVLPVAFLGRKDVDKGIAALWEDVWNEVGSAARQSDYNSSRQSFGTRIEEVLLPFLVKESTRALQDVSWARRTTGARALKELCETGILAPVPRSVSRSGPASDLLRARYRAEASSAVLRECVNVISKPRLWTGKSLVLEAAVEIVSKWAGAEASREKDDRVLYGSDDNLASSCPWKPISLTTGVDLFVGDGWFQEHPALTSADGEDGDGNEEECRPNEMEMDEAVESFQIDFGDVDMEDDKAYDKTSDADSISNASIPLSFIGFSRLLLIQATQKSQTMSDEYLPYRVAALRGLRSLMNSLPGSDEIKSFIHDSFAGESLMNIITSHNTGTTVKMESPPVVVAGALDVLAALFWDGVDPREESSNNCSAPAADDMLNVLKAAGGSHAWTVREASALCLASLAAVCSSEWLRQHRVVSTMVNCAVEAFKDRKFWKVRLASIKILQSLVARVGDRPSAEEEKQFILEAILPYKEDMLLLLNGSLKDSEAQVNAVASSVLISMSWWP